MTSAMRVLEIRRACSVHDLNVGRHFSGRRAARANRHGTREELLGVDMLVAHSYRNDRSTARATTTVTSAMRTKITSLGCQRRIAFYDVDMPRGIFARRLLATRRWHRRESPVRPSRTCGRQFETCSVLGRVAHAKPECGA